MKVHYEDDRTTIYRGDALAVLRDLPTASVDGLVTDPPYSSGGMMRDDRTNTARGKYVGGSAKHDLADFSGDSRDQRAYAYWTTLWVGECLRIVKPGGLALLFTDWRQLPTITDAIQSGGWVWRGLIPWHKPNARIFAGRITNACEYAVWGSNGPLPNPRDGGEWFPGFYQADSPRQREHITQKPIEVMRDLVKVVPEGGTVLDPFAGSGTTGVAALIEGRRFLGIELSDHYADIAVRRCREAQYQAVAKGDQAALDFGGDAA